MVGTFPLMNALGSAVPLLLTVVTKLHRLKMATTYGILVKVRIMNQLSIKIVMAMLQALLIETLQIIISMVWQLR
jgi:hypothetical protein